MIPALILAGGMGTRLAQTVPNLPKTLAPIYKTPFLHLLIEQLASTKIISKIVLALGHKASHVIDYIESKTFAIPIEISLETAPLGTGGAILHALDTIDTDLFLTVNGDSFFDIPFSDFLNFHLLKSSSLTIACTEIEQASRYGRIEMDESLKIISFTEKSDAPQRGWVSTGMYLMQKSLFSTLPKGACSLERELFPRFLKSGIYGFSYIGTFIDIGTDVSYYEAQKTLKPWIIS